MQHLVRLEREKPADGGHAAALPAARLLLQRRCIDNAPPSAPGMAFAGYVPGEPAGRMLLQLDDAHGSWAEGASLPPAQEGGLLPTWLRSGASPGAEVWVGRLLEAPAGSQEAWVRVILPGKG